MNSKLSVKDVDFICQTIKVNLFPDEMDEVLKRYDDWENSDQNDGENWSLVVENFIYQILMEKQRI
jgi:hypothetical protein